MSAEQPAYQSVLDAYIAQIEAASLEDATALSWPSGQLSHAQLIDAAASLAAWLQQRGVHPGDRIGLMLGKHPLHIIGMLAAWWLGAAFIPIDPELPPQRIADILARAKPKLCLGQERLGLLDQLTAHDETARAPRHINAPDELAYIIFTSGSTGQPKGVMIEHRGLHNLLDAQRVAFALSPSSRALLFLSLSFDASISDIGTALLSGAHLHIPAPQDLFPLTRLEQTLTERQITHIDFPPSLLGRLDIARCPTLETVIIGGEPCPIEIARKWAAQKRLVNVYGPTEATICVSMVRCDERWDKPWLGALIPAMGWVILDQALYPTEPGQPGELCLYGVGLARGYLDDPSQTAASFIWWRGKRLYRTGDLAVLDPERREVLFLGRQDSQIKLRGQRLELGEIERALLEHEGISAAAVLKHQERLIAFVETTRPQLTAAALRAQLAQRLPAWMLPAQLHIAQALPRHPSQKLDRAAMLKLIAPEDKHTVAAPPLSEDERLMQEIWRELLNVEDLGVTDDLFALGADSLMILTATSLATSRGLLSSPAAWMRGGNIRAALSPSQLAEAMSTRAIEAKLEPLLTSPAPDISRSAQGFAHREHMLLTGANGHLGCRLAVALLQDAPKAQLTLGIRGRDHETRMARLTQALHEQGISLSQAEAARIQTINLELTVPDWGIPEAQRRQLSQSLDTIIHNGAQLNMLASYEDLEAANVRSTHEAIRLATCGAPKALHYTSTLSVFVASDRPEGHHLETTHLDSIHALYGGYAQSKWAAERLLAQHPALRPEQRWIYRPGLITPDSVTGMASDAEIFGRFLRGLALMGQLPEHEDQELAIDLSPVDQVAAIMSALILGAPAQTYHIANTRAARLSQCIDALTRAGITLQRCPAQAWRIPSQQRLADADQDLTLALMALCRISPQQEYFDRYRLMDLLQATRATFDMTHTEAHTTSPALNAPIDALLDLYVRAALRRS